MPETFITPQSLKEFEKNLKKIDNWTNKAIADGLMMGASKVVLHAQAKHTRPTSRAKRIEHLDKRFYTWSGDLVGSIHPGKVQVYRDGALIEIKVPESYAAAVEYGTPRSRAFPFMKPALDETKNEVLAYLARAVKEALS